MLRRLAMMTVLVSACTETTEPIDYVPFTDDAPIPFSAGCPERRPFGSFVTRDGDRLMDGTRELRFLGFNSPNLHVLEDPIWHLPHPWEQGDALCSIVQAGGEVVRIYVISVGRSPSADLPRHVPEPGVFTEALFVALDTLLDLANRYGVRVILPFVDRWQWWGGIADYAAFHGLDAGAFYTDERVRADFARTVEFVITRVNTRTGIAYRDDPAILAWETGNELDAPDEWTEWIASFIRSLDPNHLIVDGRVGVHESSLASPHIDIVSSHYYPDWLTGSAEFASACDRDRALAAGRRAFIVGEAGLAPAQTLRDLLATVVANGTSGALLWSLRFHDAGGGFYWHTEVTDQGAYHWPGFDSGERWEERTFLPFVRESAFAIRGLDAPPIVAPSPPTLFPIDDPTYIRWRGSPGAASYTLERAEHRGGPWRVVASGFHDAVTPNNATIADPSPSGNAFYRMRAQNEGGGSAPSEIEAFVSP